MASYDMGKNKTGMKEGKKKLRENRGEVRVLASQKPIGLWYFFVVITVLNQYQQQLYHPFLFILLGFTLFELSVCWVPNKLSKNETMGALNQQNTILLC